MLLRTPSRGESRRITSIPQRRVMQLDDATVPEKAAPDNVDQARPAEGAVTRSTRGWVVHHTHPPLCLARVRRHAENGAASSCCTSWGSRLSTCLLAQFCEGRQRKRQEGITTTARPAHGECCCGSIGRQGIFTRG